MSILLDFVGIVNFLANYEETRLLHAIKTTEESFHGHIIAIITIVVLDWGPT